MKTTLHIQGAAAMAAAAMTLAACEHKELCYDHSHTVPVDVVFDWTEAPDADPDMMEVYFFPQDGSAAHRIAFNGLDGGTIELPYGNYDIITVSADGSGATANLRRGTEAWESFEIYTRDASVLEGMGMSSTTAEPPRAEGAENESGALAPDMLWSDRQQDMTVKAADRLTVTLYPEQSATRFTIEIDGAENLKYVKSVSGTLSGLSRGYFVGTDKLNAECVSVPFGMRSDRESRLDGTCLGFGHCPEENGDTPHKLVVYAVLADGSQWYYEYDVTDQVHDAPDQRDIHIRLNGLPLPKPIVNGSGMHPSVDDWENEQVDIEM